MSYNNNGTRETDIWSSQQRVKLIRFSKVRQDKDGQATRGCLVENEQGEQRWVSMPSSGGFFREIQWGSWLYYYGHGVRPSLGLLPIETLTKSSQEFLSQQQADYYAHRAEQNKRDIEPHKISFTPEAEPPSFADDELITEITSTLSQFVMMTKEFNPNLSEEAIVKLAISGYIQYQKDKQNIPY